MQAAADEVNASGDSDQEDCEGGGAVGGETCAEVGAEGKEEGGWEGEEGGGGGKGGEGD